MSTSKKPCICGTKACRATGDEATIRLPSDASERDAWLKMLGLEVASFVNFGGRVSLAHFTPSCLSAQSIPDGPCSSGPLVRLKKGAGPSETSLDEAVVGALGRAMRWEAAARHFERQEVASSVKLARCKEEAAILKARLAKAHAECKEAKSRAGRVETRRGHGINYHILENMTPVHAKSLCGLPGLKPLEKLYRVVNYAGAAEEMIFYEEAGDDEEAEAIGVPLRAPKNKRQKVFRGENGFFFALFILRTAVPIVVASALFGVNETTGGRAFSTWVRFLAGSLRPFVRLPSRRDLSEVKVPPNFEREGLEECIIVLDATEVETTRVWQTDVAAVMWSPYKQRPTTKVMLGVTPSGAICFISDTFGGRLTDADIVRQSGLISDLVKAGFGNGGFSVMADRGFNPLGMDFSRVGIKLVIPPTKRTRRGETQFSGEDAQRTRTTANLRIHVERAIGALKEWRIIHNKLTTKQMDLIPLYFQVCGSLVNLTHKKFASDL